MSPNLIERILAPDGLSASFQPIFEVGRETRLHAFECLVRGPQGTPLRTADMLFDYVRRKRQEVLVDRACVETTLCAARGLSDTHRLAVNVHASTLGADPEFVAYLVDTAQSASIDPERLVVEIVEYGAYRDETMFQNSLRTLRDLGIRVAHDVGCGNSNYRTVLECRPDYFKIDRYIVHGSHADTYRLAVLDSVNSLAPRFGASVVAEGVEDPADLEAAQSVGITLFQGPALSPPVTLAEIRDRGLLSVWGVTPARQIKDDGPSSVPKGAFDGRDERALLVGLAGRHDDPR